MSRFRVLALLGFAAALAVAMPAQAQPYPSKPITIVVPSGPAGSVDIMGRLVANKLEGVIGQKVIIENRAGAGTYIGSEHVARAAPDGYTLLSQAFGGLHGDIFVKGQPMVLPDELMPVATIAESPNLFVTPGVVPAKDMKEFVAYVKANPKKVNVAIYPGTAVHLETLAFLKQNGMDMFEVPYNSTDVIRAAMLRNEVHLYLTGPGGWIPFIQEGTIRALGITGPQRHPQLPNVTTLYEQGIKFDSRGMYAIFASKKTPQPIVEKLHNDIRKALETPESKEDLAKNGMLLPARQTQAETAKMFADYAKALRVGAKAAGIEPQ